MPEQVTASVKPKTKQFGVDQMAQSELGFLTTQQRVNQETLSYWQMRIEEKMRSIRENLAIPDHWDVDWAELFSKGTIIATMKPRPEPKVADASKETPKVEEKKEEHGTDN